MILASEGKNLLVDNSARVVGLEREIKAEREKYQHIMVEDSKHRGSLCKYMYSINVSLSYAKRRLKRVKYIRIQVETLYNRNLVLQAQIRSLKHVIGDHEMMESTRKLDVLAQVAVEVEEKQVLPESLVLEAGPST